MQNTLLLKTRYFLPFKCMCHIHVSFTTIRDTPDNSKISTGFTSPILSDSQTALYNKFDLVLHLFLGIS